MLTPTKKISLCELLQFKYVINSLISKLASSMVKRIKRKILNNNAI